MQVEGCDFKYKVEYVFPRDGEKYANLGFTKIQVRENGGTTIIYSYMIEFFIKEGAAGGRNYFFQDDEGDKYWCKCYTTGRHTISFNNGGRAPSLTQVGYVEPNRNALGEILDEDIVPVGYAVDEFMKEEGVVAEEVVAEE